MARKPNRQAIGDKAGRYPVATTRQGKRAATVYLPEEALDALRILGIKERVTMQKLLVEGVNSIFERRAMARIA